MDPLLLFFVSTAVCATLVLVIAHFFIYIKNNKTTVIDNTTQTQLSTCTSTQTSTHASYTHTKGLQVPDKKYKTVNKGCDASSTCYGSTATEQIKIFQESETKLQDLIKTKHSDIGLRIQRFTKDILEHTAQQYQILETIRNEIIQQQSEIQKVLATDIQNFCTQTQDNLRKVQESLRYEVQCSTNNIVHQLLYIPPPPPRPWLYLPYGRHTRSSEAHQERRARQNLFWTLRRQQLEVSTDTAEAPMEGEDAQSLD